MISATNPIGVRLCTHAQIRNVATGAYVAPTANPTPISAPSNRFSRINAAAANASTAPSPSSSGKKVSALKKCVLFAIRASAINPTSTPISPSAGIDVRAENRSST